MVLVSYRLDNQVSILQTRVHHDLGYTVPSMTGGTAYVTLPRGDRGASALGVGVVGHCSTPYARSGPPFCHDGTERPIPRPADATEQKTCYSGKKKRHMLINLLLINATLRIVFLSETAPGSVHDKRLADFTPSPLPAGSHLLQ